MMNSNQKQGSEALAAINALFPEADIMTPAGYLSAVRKGVSGETLRTIVNAVGESEVIAKTIGNDVSILSKSYQLKRLSPIASDNLIGTLRVYVRAIMIYESVDVAKEWMNTSIPALGGEIPISLLDTHAGRELVHLTLRRIEAGEYV
ncbi:antitoxin Xre/MbcA/ParS toxin-binding domain-containing protein [Maribrevibacterium harenarium]|nr:antitoxin Xre/MbcA/ParS toxin-binding domain-containing protein [Maribrevibacterium harenarium]